MKVIEKNNMKAVKMSEVEVGECFIMRGGLYMRLYDEAPYLEYVNLRTGSEGRRTRDQDHSHVDCIPVYAEVTWNYKD